MKLGGVKIINLDSLKGKFELKEVWENIENGVLLDCQRDLAIQGAELSEPIVKVLEGLDTEEGLEEIISGFYREQEWDLDGLRQVLKPFCAKSKDHSGNDFYSRNIGIIRNLVEQGQIAWDKRKAALFFLFLILMLQVRPRMAISKEEVLFIQKELGSLGGKTEERKEAGNGRRLYPYEGGVFYLLDGKIVNERGTLFSPIQEEIAFFAYTKRLGIIAFTVQGEISDCTEANVRYEIRCRLDTLKKEEQRVVMVAACYTVYVLLTVSGRVISNVQDCLEGWKKIRWVGAGLNSVTAIRERSGNLLELGSDSRITEFSGVRAAYTWSEGKCRYGVLKEGGSWIMDDGFVADGVCAGNLDRDGYVYAVGRELIFRRYGEGGIIRYRIGGDREVVEVCKYRAFVYYRLEGEEIGRVAVSEFC